MPQPRGEWFLTLSERVLVSIALPTWCLDQWCHRRLTPITLAAPAVQVLRLRWQVLQIAGFVLMVPRPAEAIDVILAPMEQPAPKVNARHALQGKSQIQAAASASQRGQPNQLDHCQVLGRLRLLDLSLRQRQSRASPLPSHPKQGSPKRMMACHGVPSLA